jgi:peroxiredoxin (alkyl hydroperoxide reductase subunit C)
MSLIGQKAPEWSAAAYVNGEEKVVSSADYAGKWYVLYWYPLDFTFVCPTEIKGFQELLEDFADDGVDVIGASTDSFFSHSAWFADRETFPQKISHPVLGDTNHSVSRAFGVLKEDGGVAFRATVIVDNEGVVRSISINDLSAGRSPKEVLRTVQALQSGGLCGADWSKGEDFVG